MSLLKKTLSALFAGALLLTGALRAHAVEPGAADSVTAAAAAILGTALKGSIENIEQLGAKLDRQALMEMLGRIVDGEQPPYSYEKAYSIIDNHVVELQRIYVDSVFSVENQKAFVDEAATAEGAIVTPSGLVFQVITEGEGVTPASGDDVRLNYVAKFSDGSEFDRTEEPVVFDVDRLVPGFTEGLKLMKPGGKYRIVIPAELGYGTQGIPGEIPPNAALDFTIDLLQVIPKPSAN